MIRNPRLRVNLNLAHFSKELEKQDSEKNKNVKAKKKRKPEL